MNLDALKNIKQFEKKAKKQLHPELYNYLNGGADDLRTIKRNQSTYSLYQIRPRQLIDFSQIDPSIQLLG